MLNPLAATLPERVPTRQRGAVAGFTGLAFPLSNLFGALVIGIWLTDQADRLAVIVMVTVFSIVPFIVMGFRLPRSSAGRPRRGLSFSALSDRDFLIALGSRLFVQTAIALNVLYLFFYLEQETGVAEALGGVRIEVAVGGLLAISTVLAVIAGLIGGRVSDRIGRRRALVFVGASLIALGVLLMALFPSWPGPLAAQSLLGIGVGLYGITDSVLVAEVLPSPADAGQDLGLLNVAVTAAQMLAPMLGLLALAWYGNDLRSVYGIGAALALLGGASVMAIRRVR